MTNTLTDELELENKTTDVSDATLADWWDEYSRCNAFALSMLADGWTLKVGEVNGQIHCWAHDRNRDITVDATLGQFDGHSHAGAWDGDHPHEDAGWVESFDDAEAFKEEFYGTHSPFHEW